MSLGGLAVAIGMLVDGSVVMVENNLPASVGFAVTRACLDRPSSSIPLREVSRPIVFGIVIIRHRVSPVDYLGGMEGKLFAPMAYTIMIALLVSLALSLTLSPPLSVGSACRQRRGYVPGSMGQAFLPSEVGMGLESP